MVRASELGRQALRVNPARADHLVATRAAVSVVVPLLVVVWLGRLDWAPWVSFGALTSLYGRTVLDRDRFGQQLWAGASLCAAVVSGVLISGLPHVEWWVVVLGSVVSFAGSLLGDAVRWHPPGPLFMLFGLAVCASTGVGASRAPVALVVCASTVAFSLVVGQVGAAVGGRLGRPRIPRPHFTRALTPEDALRHLLRFVLATSLAGTIATLVGGTHPYWAMVAACAALGGPDLAARLVRGVHRVIGTLVGLVLAAAVLGVHPRGVWLVVVIAALQWVTEVLVGRNYALACVFITPLALSMGQLAHEVPVNALIVDRGWETLLGAAVAILVLLAIPSNRTSITRQ
ncbi:hypothetical protein AESSP_01775 [Aestuariimicrobium sp. T2.26MG-19.2B]|nr:hypothetical protein AESSP_01775 [Aestuariimicrobium sp. T2.26MG-19.2B]